LSTPSKGYQLRQRRKRHLSKKPALRPMNIMTDLAISMPRNSPKKAKRMLPMITLLEISRSIIKQMTKENKATALVTLDTSTMTIQSSTLKLKMDLVTLVILTTISHKKE
jgi:hypothetical protein